MNSRGIRARTQGQQHGFIRRMVSPGDLGALIKPFVFLDHVEGVIQPGTGFGWHPHSGIATLTYSLNSDAAYEDTAGQKGRVEATGLEWMRAGSGTWHKGFIYPREKTVTAFQLWVALPPEHEEGPPEGIYVAPHEVPHVNNVRVLLGEYGGVANPIPVPSPLVYLDVALALGESWTFHPPEDHTVAWLFVYRGKAQVAGIELSQELAVLDEGNESITIEATDDARVLFGTARKHEHPLVLGRHSIHTSQDALVRGEKRIREVYAELLNAGRM